MADQRYTGKQEEEKRSLLGGIAKTGAAVGGGVLAYRNRAAIGRGIRTAAEHTSVTSSRLLSQNGQAYSALSDAKMFMRGVSDALGDKPGVMRTLRAGVDQGQADKFRLGYENSIRNTLANRQNVKNRPGDADNQASNAFIRDFHKREAKGLDPFQQKATEAFRHNKVIDELLEKTSVKSGGGQSVVGALSSYSRNNKDFFNRPQNHMAEFTKELETGIYKGTAKFEDDTQREIFQKQLLETLEKYKSTNDVYNNNKAAIGEKAAGMKTAATFSFIQEQIKKTKGYASDLKKGQGFNQVKLSDVEKMNDVEKRKHGILIDDPSDARDDKIIDVSVELRKLLNESKDNKDLNRLLKEDNIEFDFKDIIMDSHVYKHEKTGEILDDRHLRTGAVQFLDKFQENVKVPFLNINPLDLTPWQAIRSGKAKEGLHVLSSGQTHGFVKNLGDQVFDEATKFNQKDAIRNPLKNSNHFYTGGNVFRHTEAGGLEKIDSDLYLVPSQFGPFSRMHKNMTNMTDREDLDQRGTLGKLFDLGHQESESRMQTYLKAIRKTADPKYGPNALTSLVHELATNPNDQVDKIQEVYSIMRVGIGKNTQSLSREATEIISEDVNKLFKGTSFKVDGEDFDFARLADDRYVVEAALSLNREIGSKATNDKFLRMNNRKIYNDDLTDRTDQLAIDPARKFLQQNISSYIKDPIAFAASREAAIDRRLPSGLEFIVPSLGDQEPMITATEKLRRSFHQYALRSLDYEAGDFGSEIAGQGIRRRSSLQKLEEAQAMGRISGDDVKAARDLELYSDILSYNDIYDVEKQSKEAKTFLNDIMSVQGRAKYFDENAVIFEGGDPALTQMGHELQAGILRAQPIWGRAPEAAKDAPNGADFIIMRKSGLGKAGREIVSELNLKNIGKHGPIEDGMDLAYNTEMYVRNGTKTMVEQGKNIVQEMFAGRRAGGDSLENVTTSTALLYGLAERVNNQVGNLGLAISQKHLGTVDSIIGNQYARRIALPVAVYQQAIYFDGLTGDTVSDTAADAYVNSHETLNSIKNITGINKALKPWAEVFKSAGGDQVGEWMGVKQLDFLTMGLFSDFRSGEEVREFYESGETAIRKNRYWGIGSPSPWAGNGIDRFEANWYRKMKSDYKFTDTMYGDEGEYWSNHWMPTLTNPLAPLKHFVTDPYHYEKKHEADRPYAITGGFSSIQNIPIIGATLDGTVGRILKPRREHKGLEKAHEEYIAAINQKIIDGYSPVHDGSYVGISGTGAVEQYNMFASPGTGDYLGGAAANYGADAGVVNQGNALVGRYPNANKPSGGFGAGVGTGGLVSAGGAGGGNGSGTGTATDSARAILAAQNYALSLEGDGVKSDTVNRLHKLQNQLMPLDLDDVGHVDDLHGNVLDGFYSGSEIAGLYGFMTKTAIGYQEGWRSTVLAPSSLMSNTSRVFWDMNLGGAGGSLSEIGRRYAPRDPNKGYYSPIRNTMPDWLPGVGEQDDFLHGDPYVKIQKGEIRLPGKAYEKLYKLHPDGTGSGDTANYGILDRFRILGDVAPDSEQYKVAKHQIALLREAGGITEEMDKEIREIKAQVSAKQDTYRWYDKKFSNADIIEKDVTITRVLDQNTFMVDEYDEPIKLAGIKLTQDKNEDAIAWLGQYIKVGEKVKIGVSADAATRINQDTYGTMDAVVYSKKNEEGRFWFETSKGTSINAMLANKVWKNKVETKDKGTAATTRALYSDDMVTVGKYMEMLTHDILPKVPFVGILADKFMQVRTPIESYKRDQIYGSDWRPWQQPYEGWIKPMVNTIASQNPLIAGAEMAAIGHLWGRNSAKARGLGRIAGFAIGAGTASLRVLSETGAQVIPGGDNLWLPQERQDERDINQYFDRLKYVKYRGLYEQAARIAESEEGVNVNDFFDAAAEKGEKNKSLKRFLTDKKKTLSFSKKMGYGDAEAVESQIDTLSMGLEEVSGAKEAFQAGRFTSLAIKFRQEYEGTLYGMAESGSQDRTALMRALTPKEREYVPRFLEANNSKERQEILKYVPEDIKRILQGSWGLDPEAPESIEKFFDKNYLPGQNWSGWSASANLDDVKIKVMKKEGLNPTVSGYWGADQDRADQSGAKAIPMHSLSSRIDSNRLDEVLKGLGLSDVDVQLTTTYGNGPGGVNTSINIMKDVRGEILDTLNESKSTLF